MRKGIFRNLWLNYDGNFKVDVTNALKDIYDSYANGLTLGSISASATEINRAADSSVQASYLSAGAGITGGTGTDYKSAIVREGNIRLSTIYIDLTGLDSIATDLDVIGHNIATDLPAYLGRVAVATTGTIVGEQMTCLEVPTTGADDIDLYAADDADKVVDNPTSGFTNGVALVTAGGAWSLMETKKFIAYPSVDQYLYLISGEAVAGTYDAGRFLIELWGI